MLANPRYPYVLAFWVSCRYRSVSPLTLCLRGVDGHPLPIDKLRGIKPTEAIDLSKKGLAVASGIIIASCIAGNEHLKLLRCAMPSHTSDTARYQVLAHQILYLCGSLAYNNIGHSKKGVEAVSALADAFTKMPNLHTVE